MTLSRHLRRAVPALALVLCVVSVSGCKWMRAPSPYAQSPENRPLEVPPDLSLPTTTQAMRIPPVAAAPAAPARAALAASSAAFVVADSKASTWRRVGLALERIDGVEIRERVELVGAYNVNFRGESLLVNIADDGANARVSAVGGDGRESGSAAASALLGELRQRLM
jgi:uncharacterized lipoprotein